jgi:regulator of sirC expression with transglutaminase-like and TPR domain
MVQLLSEWMETFPYDFRDERVMQHVRQLTQRCVALDPSLRRDVSQMLHNLLHRLTALEKYEEFLEKINTEASAALIDTVNVVRTVPFIPTFYPPNICSYKGTFFSSLRD